MSEDSLSEQLKRILESNTPQSGPPVDGVPIGSIVDSVGDKGFGLLLVILSLPSALPVPAAGYSIPFGIVLFLLGLQMIGGRSKPALPERFRRTKLSSALAPRMIGAAAWIFKRIEWFIRPRLHWVGSKGGSMLMGGLVIFMATLMMIPIPSTNTLPAFVIFLIGVGLTEDDGLFLIGACFFGLVSAALYIALLYAIIHYGPEVIDTVKDWLKELFGLSSQT